MTLLLALACGTTDPGATTPTGTTPAPTTPSPQPTTTASTGDTGKGTGTVDTSTPSTSTTLPAGLHGIPPVAPAPPINFVATNRDGTPRDRNALIGQPTVLWFYPAAGTGG